eukprot:c9002_g1_i1.p2 GENE.c9002_g1_i1~~c9002_g1_i1.p2  ORF type:complete len:166 (-),score=45.51 c9002_g1_i1:83-580(-)
MSFEIQLPDLAEEANEASKAQTNPIQLLAGNYDTSDESEVEELPAPDEAILAVAATGLPEFLRTENEDLSLSWHDGEDEDEEDPRKKRKKLETKKEDERVQLKVVATARQSHKAGALDRGVTMPAEQKKQKLTVKDKEKAKRKIGQSTHSRWKTEDEMKLRQQFD